MDPTISFQPSSQSNTDVSVSHPSQPFGTVVIVLVSICWDYCIPDWFRKQSLDSHQQNKDSKFVPGDLICIPDFLGLLYSSATST